MSKDRFFFSFQIDSGDLMALVLCVYHFSLSKKLWINWEGKMVTSRSVNSHCRSANFIVETQLICVTESEC